MLWRLCRDFIQQRRSLLGSLAFWPFVLVPFGVLLVLLNQYLVDTPVMDDWTFLEDWIRFTEHRLALRDLFTAHMEHRVALPRAMALAAHMVGGADLRWQNVYTALILCGTWWNLARLLQKASGATRWQMRWPMLLTSLVLFSPIQWQGLLWPILFEAYLPFFLFTVAARLWVSELNGRWALLGSAACALGGMWSFANGVVTLGIVPVLIWTCRRTAEPRTRLRWIGAWLLMSAAAIGLYFVNFGNAVVPQFAYGQGNETTVGHSMTKFLGHLPAFPHFVTAVLGSHLSRGLWLDNLALAEGVGAILLGLFLWVVIRMGRFARTDTAGWVSLGPWVGVGLFGIGTAILIAMGRIWVSKTPAAAVSIRYVSHAVPLTIAVISLVWIKFRDPVKALPGQTWVPAAYGLSLLLACTQWVYGWRNMQLWSEGRLQGKALLLFAQLYPDPSPLGIVGGDGAYTRKLALEMENDHIMHPSLLKDRSLSSFRIHAAPLRPDAAALTGLRRRLDGVLEGQGWAELPEGRPADLMVFTAEEDGKPRIEAVGALEFVPNFLRGTSKRDREYLPTPLLTRRWTATLAGPLYELAPIKDLDGLKAWAFDVKQMKLYAVTDRRHDATVYQDF